MSELKQKRDWPALRAEYEQSGRVVTHAYLAQRENIPVQTIAKRSMREGWRKQQQIVAKAFSDLEKTVDERVNARLREELAPWIDRHKTQFIKSTYSVASNGLKRARAYQRSKSQVEPREEANISKAAESYHRIGAAVLGLNNGSAVSGPLQVNILTNRSAVQVISPDSLG